MVSLYNDLWCDIRYAAVIKYNDLEALYMELTTRINFEHGKLCVFSLPQP